MYKNVASQKVAVYAHDTSADAPKTGDAANITAYISKDGAADVQSNDVNPSEIDAATMEGVYVFDLTQAETNCDLFILCAESSTANVSHEPIIAYTVDYVQSVTGAVGSVTGAVGSVTGAVGSVTGIGGMAGAVGFALIASFAGNLLDFFEKQGNIHTGYTILFAIAGSAYILAWIIMKLMSPKMKRVEDLV